MSLVLARLEVVESEAFPTGKGTVFPVLPLVAVFSSSTVWNHFSLSQYWFCPNSLQRWPYVRYHCAVSNSMGVSVSE